MILALFIYGVHLAPCCVKSTTLLDGTSAIYFKDYVTKDEVT